MVERRKKHAGRKAAVLAGLLVGEETLTLRFYISVIQHPAPSDESQAHPSNAPLYSLRQLWKWLQEYKVPSNSGSVQMSADHPPRGTSLQPHRLQSLFSVFARTSFASRVYQVYNSHHVGSRLVYLSQAVISRKEVSAKNLSQRVILIIISRKLIRWRLALFKDQYKVCEENSQWLRLGFRTLWEERTKQSVDYWTGP